MSQDKEVGASLESAQCRDSLKVYASHTGFAQLGLLIGRELRFLGFPDFLSDIVNYRILQFIVVLSQCGLTDTLHDGVAVFHAVTDAARSGVDEDPVVGNAEVFKKNIQLFSQRFMSMGVFAATECLYAIAAAPTCL